MRPRLLVLSGPLKDETFPLPEGETGIGREASNQIAIGDPSVSRRHCSVRWEGGRFVVRDLGSRNGTVVNGSAVEEQWLQHGDELAIGDSSFLFLLEDEDLEPAAGRVEFEEDLGTSATTILQPRDSVYLQPERLSRELPANARLARNLNALLKISRIVHAIANLNELQEQLLELIFEVVPADRGAILLGEGEGPNFNSEFVRTRKGGGVARVKVSRTVARQVFEQGVAILGSDVPGSNELKNVASLAASEVRSLLCVPLMVFQRVMGCIYLDSDSLGSRLSEEHLQLLTAIAGISAVALENARRLHWLEQENERLTVEIGQEWSLVGDGGRIREVHEFIKRAAPIDSTVLIEGESGTGKELAARALHRKSARGNKPFVAINCGAIPAALLESDLFGHERGAFTGAAALKRGRIEIADGGVVFLDEIGELAPELQVKLLRVLQEREFERVGGLHSIKVNIRLIAATNSNLQQAMREGDFRQDLFYRLAVLRITMPALRERRDDIGLLARHFVQKHAKRCGVKPRPISREALACMVNYEWPGNVRELENAIERALVLGESETIRPEDLPESLLEGTPPSEVEQAKYHAAVKEKKKQLILEAMEQAQGSYAEAARSLGVHPNYLHRLIRNLELKEALRDFRRGA
ncbi:MAG: sigma 54-interacting transcriptional regulator [Candidatus Sulfotelmatobacter sp.]